MDSGWVTASTREFKSVADDRELAGRIERSGSRHRLRCPCRGRPSRGRDRGRSIRIPPGLIAPRDRGAPGRPRRQVGGDPGGLGDDPPPAEAGPGPLIGRSNRHGRVRPGGDDAIGGFRRRPESRLSPGGGTSARGSPGDCSKDRAVASRTVAGSSTPEVITSLGPKAPGARSLQHNRPVVRAGGMHPRSPRMTARRHFSGSRAISLWRDRGASPRIAGTTWMRTSSAPTPVRDRGVGRGDLSVDRHMM